MTYLNPPKHYSQADFKTLVDGLTWDKGWTPLFPTLHNTGVPSLVQYMAYGADPKERWGQNLNLYYQNKGWHSGVHLVACPDYIWNLCDLTADGVSVSCWNHITIGIEMIGNYEVGGDDFLTGYGAKVRDNAVWTLAVLANKFKWNLSDYVRGLTGLHFHRECPQDGHPCPGSLVDKGDILRRVAAQVEIFKAADPAQAPKEPTFPGLPIWPPAGNEFFTSAAKVYKQFIKLGASVPFAIGMLTQAEFESAFKIDVRGDDDSAIGIFQIHCDRAAVIKAKTGIDLAANPPLESQCLAAWWELHNTEPTALKALQVSTNASQAAQAACQYYERAGAENAIERRGRGGERWSNWISKNQDFINSVT